MTRVRSHRKKKRSQSRHSSSNSSLLSLSQSSLNDGYSSRSQKESSQEAPLSQRLSQFLERITSPAPAARRDRSRTVNDLVSRSAVRPTANARPSQLDRLEYFSQSQASQNSCDSPTYSARSQSRQPRYAAEPVRGNDLDELEILTQPPPSQSRYQLQAPTRTREQPHNSMPTRTTHGTQQSQESFMYHNDSSRGRQLHTNAAASVRSSSSTVLESPRARRTSPLKDIMMMSEKPHDFSSFLDSPGSASVSHMSTRMENQRRAQGRMSSNGTSFVPSSARSVSDVRSHAASTALFDSTSNRNSGVGTTRMNTDTSRSSALFPPTSPAVSVCMSEINMRHVHGIQPQPRPSAHPVPASTRSHRSISLFGNNSVVPTSAPPKQHEQITKPHASTTTLLASASRISANSRTVPLFGNSTRQSPRQNVNASASSNLLSASSRLMEAKTTSSLNRPSTGSSNGEGESRERVTLDDDDDDDDDDLPETCATQEAEALLPSPEKRKDVPKSVAHIHSGGVDRKALTTELESLKESLVGGLAEMFAKLQEELKSELKREVASSVESHVAKLAETEKSLSKKVTNAEQSMMAKCTQVERSFNEKLGESQGVLLAKVVESVSDRVDSVGNRIESLKRDIADVVASQSSQLQSTLSSHAARCVDELSSLSENSKSQMSNLKQSVISLGERVEELKREPPVIRHQMSQSTQTRRVVSPPRAKTSSQSCQTTPKRVTQHASQCVQTDAAKPRRVFVLGTPVKRRRLFILTEPKAQSSVAATGGTARQAKNSHTASKKSGRRQVTRPRTTTKSARRRKKSPPKSAVALNTRSRRRTTAAARSSDLNVINSSEKVLAPTAVVNRVRLSVPSKRRTLTQKKRQVTPKFSRKQNHVPFCATDSASETDASTSSPPAKRAKTSNQVVATTVERGKVSGKQAKSNATSEATNKGSLPPRANLGTRKKKFSALDPPATPESVAPNQPRIAADSPEFIPLAPKPKANSSPPSNVWKGRRGRVTATKRTYKKRVQDSKKSPNPQRYLDFGSDVDGKTDDASDTDCSESGVPPAVSQTSEKAYLDLIQEMRRGKPASPPKYRVTRKRQHTASKLRRPSLYASAMEDSDSDAASVHDPYASPSPSPVDSESKSDKRRAKRKTTQSSIGSTQPRANPRQTRSKASANVRAAQVFSPKTWRSVAAEEEPSAAGRRAAGEEPATGRRSRRAAKPPARSFMVSF